MVRLARFSIIVAIDKNGGIAKHGNIPWSNPDLKFFRETTVGSNDNNAIIMGRITYETIPPNKRPLPRRKNIIISRSMAQDENTQVIVRPDLASALEYCAMDVSIGEVFIGGGEQVYELCLEKYMYLCDKIYITRFPENYDCDQHFSLPLDILSKVESDADYQLYKKFKNTQITSEFTRYFLQPTYVHPEEEYKNLLKKIISEGETKQNRTGVMTLSLFSQSIKFDLRNWLPIITLKKVNYHHIIKELLFFISGKTDTKILEAKGVDIWKKNTSKKFLEERNLDYPEGFMGPGYPWQWRKWGADYSAELSGTATPGIDQLDIAIKNIKENPSSRRICVSAWNVSDLDKMVLPPCHFFYQFNVRESKYLDCNVCMRSCDMALGFCYNLTSYALLVYMIAHLTGLTPGMLSFQIGDAHIYANHVAGVKRMLKRTPKPFPTLHIRKADTIQVIDNFTEESFAIEGYDSWDFIKFELN
jgi:dihydrofolate reductase / thymidylate synthase